MPHQQFTQQATRWERAAAWRRDAAVRAPGPWKTWPATAAAVAAARNAVVRAARAAGAPELLLADVRLAVSEACTNAVVHAYAAPGVRGETFAVATAFHSPFFAVWVTDEGRGVSACAPSEGLGLGLGLLAQLCERVRVGVLDDGRTQVEMRFDLTASSVL